MLRRLFNIRRHTEYIGNVIEQKTDKLKILFYFPNESTVRNAPLSYTSLQAGAGFSGTETAILEISKYLVDHGNSVQIFGGNGTYVDHGIQFISEHELSRVDTDVDWYSPLFFLHLYNQNQVLNRINPDRTKVFLWFHCFIDNTAILELQRRFRIYGQYVSKYVSDEYPHIISVTNSWVIYNGINPIFTELPIPDSSVKHGKWIFHPVYERGGEVAKAIFHKVHVSNPAAAKHMNILSYYTPDLHKHQSSDLITNLGSKTKTDVRDLLLTSDYFIYPLVLPDSRVHHDTFASVMLEALACGAIVVVWDVACISDIYGDHVVKIPVPNHIKHTYNPKARFASCPWMLTDEAQQLFVDKIHELEANPDQKKMIRSRGAAWARTITWDSLGCDMEQQLTTH